MELSLRPKNIIIVGGGSGVGYAAAEKLLCSGDQNVILASRNKNKLQKAKKSLAESLGQTNNNIENKIHILDFDITKIKEHEALLEKSQNMIEDAQLDGLVISSGINFDGSNWKGWNISETDWDNVMNTNLKGVFFLMRNFANLLYSKSVKGNICVVSSISAHRDLLSVYQIAKLSLSRIVHAYGKYLGERGIILNCVEPGPVYTDLMKGLADFTDGIRPGKQWNDNSIRRTIRAEEIAELIYLLMTQLGEPLSGSCILAGGGTKALFP